MNGSTRHRYEAPGERGVARLLGEAAARLSPAAGDTGGLRERVLGGGTDRLVLSPSPLGEVYVGIGAAGVRMIGREPSPEAFARRYRERFGRLLSWSADDAATGLARRVAAALAEGRATLGADLSGSTPFGRRVLEVVSGIPRGEVRPYAWVAREAGSPGASRAVGTVMARNPVPLLVPCHRVIRNDGSPGLYAFGAPEKVRLLREEGVPVEEVSASPYLATPTTGIFCHATCHNARRIRPENRRRFRSAGEALRSGFRPCRTCRPAVETS